MRLVLAQGCEKFGDWVVSRKGNEACGAVEKLVFSFLRYVSRRRK